MVIDAYIMMVDVVDDSKLVGGLEHDFHFSTQLGMSSSELTFTPIFQRD
jgi:hypothetical protein